MTETLLDLGFDVGLDIGPQVAPVVRAGDSKVRCGTSSWADRSLVRDGDFYPRKTMTARDRLAYYCSQLPLAEIATTYRFPPTPDVARQWVDRTPAGFCFDVRAWSLLTENPTLPDSLWEDLQDRVRPETRHRRRLYAAHLNRDAVDECWGRFEHALRPLRSAGRLGVVILQYPSWFTPKAETRAVLAEARARLPDYRLAVELRSRKWVEGAMCEDTLEWLERHDLAFVCTDGPREGPRAMPEVVAATASVAVVRFVGRRTPVTDDPDSAWPWPYRYRDGELEAWVARVKELALSVGASGEVHLIFDNCWRDDAVGNALTMTRMLSAAG
ncbi:MAG TPA: DUF72 domain-containing protein [Acidimicrobiales bacterium]|nr:DUF72 domain-containing protein [Acidimicrobiales bacterium]